MENELKDFVTMLQKRAGTSRPRLSQTMVVDDLESKKLVLQSLYSEEMENAKRETDPKRQDIMALYLGCPTLREAAVELLRLETIDEPIEIVSKFFKPADILTHQINIA